MSDSERDAGMPQRASVGAVAEEQASAGRDEDNQYLTFRLHGEMYAFGILNVKEILEYGKVTEVPMMPDFIQGVINLRGEVVAVVNLARRFRFEAPAVTKRTCVVIIEVPGEEGHQELGVMVDSVSEVLQIPAEDIRAAPGFGARIRADFIKGMGKVGDDFVIILAEDRVLSVDELAMVEQLRQDTGQNAEAQGE